MPQDLITRTSSLSVAETVERVRAGLDERALTLFALIDHAKGARDAGFTLADEVLLVFGNPAAGTPVMQADPRAGLELPLRLLIWDDAGVTRLAYRDLETLAGSFALADRVDTLHKLALVMKLLLSEVPEAADPS
ncbi:DUF302 domain-containing protein [Naasia aerilata]|uniref:DUF302 domain-containing protein n=1 Tax=Naasia aerilata TaxID=1162966 RepID=A0ABN6XNK2_9MICO|nr:DUF302 domain-containing protein [Naasia aerilata]BDZ46585.1 hypothetical protein GCM10025866_24940 [Naasia aerilata]